MFCQKVLEQCVELYAYSENIFYADYAFVNHLFPHKLWTLVFSGLWDCDLYLNSPTPSVSLHISTYVHTRTCTHLHCHIPPPPTADIDAIFYVFVPGSSLWVQTREKRFDTRFATIYRWLQYLHVQQLRGILPNLNWSAQNCCLSKMCRPGRHGVCIFLFGLLQICSPTTIVETAP